MGGGGGSGWVGRGRDAGWWSVAGGVEVELRSLPRVVEEEGKGEAKGLTRWAVYQSKERSGSSTRPAGICQEVL